VFNWFIPSLLWRKGFHHTLLKRFKKRSRGRYFWRYEVTTSGRAGWPAWPPRGCAPRHPPPAAGGAGCQPSKSILTLEVHPHPHTTLEFHRANPSPKAGYNSVNSSAEWAGSTGLGHSAATLFLTARTTPAATTEIIYQLILLFCIVYAYAAAPQITV